MKFASSETACFEKCVDMKEMNSEALPGGVQITRGRGRRHLFLDLENKPEGLKDFKAVLEPRKRLGRIVVLEIDQLKRRCGVGTKWVQWFESYSKRFGVVEIIGKVFPGTEDFWIGLGYKLNPPKVAGNMLRMRKILAEH